jgi:hypothetical protein
MSGSYTGSHQRGFLFYFISLVARLVGEGMEISKLNIIEHELMLWHRQARVLMTNGEGFSKGAIVNEPSQV